MENDSNKKKICFITTYMADENSNMNNNLRGRVPKGLTLNKSFGNYDFYLFTNIKNFSLPNWTSILLSNDFLDKQIKVNSNTKIKKNVYRSRYPKFMGWKYLKEVMNKDYDIIFYSDIHINIHESHDWQNYAIDIMNSDWGIMQMMHPRKNTIYKECNDINKLKIDDMTKTIHFLNDNSADENYLITQNGIFGYTPKNEKILNAFNMFWDIYTTTKMSYRDQPLWGYVSWKLNINPVINNTLYDGWNRQACMKI
tara:strand:+ start:4492 stop:5253 length:762 start_codon:yes stop_codon:yes gene_type:complete